MRGASPFLVAYVCRLDSLRRDGALDYSQGRPRRPSRPAQPYCLERTVNDKVPRDRLCGLIVPTCGILKASELSSSWKWQRLKACGFAAFSACLKACPDTNQEHGLIRIRGRPDKNQSAT